MADSKTTQKILEQMANMAHYNQYEIEELKVQRKELKDAKMAFSHELREKEKTLRTFTQKNNMAELEANYKSIRNQIMQVKHEISTAKETGDLEKATLLGQYLDLYIKNEASIKQLLTEFHQLSRDVELVERQVEKLKLEIEAINADMDENKPLDLTQQKQGVAEYIADFKKLNGERGEAALAAIIAQRLQAGESLYTNEFEYRDGEIVLSQQKEAAAEEEKAKKEETEPSLAGGQPIPLAQAVEPGTEPQMTEAEADEKVAAMAQNEASKMAEVKQTKPGPKLMKKVTDKVKGLTFLEKLKIILGGLFIIAYPFSFIAPILLGAEVMGPELTKKK